LFGTSSRHDRPSLDVDIQGGESSSCTKPGLAEKRKADLHPTPGIKKNPEKNASLLNLAAPLAWKGRKMSDCIDQSIKADVITSQCRTTLG